MIDELTPYTMPNADNGYLFSRLSSDRTYRLSGNCRGRSFIVALGSGEYAMWNFAEIRETPAWLMDVDADGSFEIILSGREHAGNWIRLDPAVTNLHIRDYWLDWDDDPGWFHLECLDPAPSRPPTALSLGVPDRLARAGEFFATMIDFWAEYADRLRTDAPNTMSDPAGVPMGSTGLIRYSVGWTRLDPEQAPYWGIQLYSRFGVPLDPAIAQSSLNCRQAVPDADGMVRFVVAARDPGVANWLDSRGYPETAILYRGLDARAMNAPRVEVLGLGSVSDRLPGAVRVSGEDRMAALAARERGFARRYRR